MVGYINSKIIGIVGLGPRGLNVLERIMTYAYQYPDQKIYIEIFEPNELGSGIHSSKLPDYLRLNTIACQLSMYPDDKSLPNIPKILSRPGQNLYDWANEQIRNTGKLNSLTAEIAATDFLPRNVLGSYLNNFYHDIYKNKPDNVIISHNKERVKTIKLNSILHDGTQNKKMVLSSDSGDKIVDFIIITTGHNLDTHLNNESEHLNPTNQALESIHDGSNILLEGMGLVAMDVIAQLTLGRGGEFYKLKDKLLYKASGKEPKIWLKSKGGLPYKARPDSKGNYERYKPHILTDEYLTEIKNNAPDNGLDFEKDILPHLKIEMRIAYLLTVISNINPNSVRDALLKLSATEPQYIEAIVLKLESQYGGFDPDIYITNDLPNHVTIDNYSKWICAIISSDLKEAKDGLEISPIKVAFEIWRDLRDTIRSAVNGSVLEHESLKLFYSKYNRIINRLVAGPQKERLYELLCLVEAGVVTLLHPDASIENQITTSDKQYKHIRGFLPPKNIVKDPNTIIRDLQKNKIVTSNDIGGLAVNQSNFLLGVNGTVSDKIWALGPLVEGSKYYNHYVPSAGSPSQAFLDAHYIAKNIMEFNFEEQSL